MKIKLNLEIENLYGGDGILRYEEEKKIKLTRNKSKKTTKSTTGVSTEAGVDEEKYETQRVAISTFDLQDGKPTYRFGGIHGKLWGHIRAVGKTLVDLGVEGIDSKAMIDRVMLSVNITPIILKIENYEPIKTIVIPQKMNGIGNSMQFLKYDYIPKCNVDLELSFPDVYEKIMQNILENIGNYAGLNKRRAIIKIVSSEVISDGHRK